MNIEQPIDVTPNKDKTVTLHFKEQKPAKLNMRGGVCWPIMVGKGQTQSVQGFALLSGFDPVTGRYYIFEELSFVTVEHVVSEEGLITHHGVGMFFNMCWNKYLCDKFYYNQQHETHRKYFLEVVRSESVNPNPRMVSVQWDEDAIANQSVAEKAQLNLIKWQSGTKLDDAIQSLVVDPDHVSPEWRALRCCMVGYDRFPWRKPREV